MKEILTVNPKVPLYNKDIRVVEWTHGDPFPEMGPSVGVDTETELITDSVLFPPVVVLGCFDGENQICYIVHWQDIPEFMHHLCVREIEQRYFNLGFDEGVIDNEDDCKILLEAIDAGRVRDMQIRIHLNDIATKGWIPPEDYSLKGCSMAYLGLELDKGDGTENSARLSFRRDRQITEEQYRYLPFDCIATWMLGELKNEKLVESVEDAQLVKEAPVDKNTGRSIEIVHTQGMVALAHIRANGFPVDMRIFDALEAKLKADYADAKKVIVDMGFPDPDYDAKEEKAQMELKYADNMRMFLGDTADFSVPSKMDIRQMIAVLYAVDGVEDPEQISHALNLVREAAMDGVKSLRKGKKGEKGPSKWWDEVAEKFGLLAFTNSGRPIVMLAFITKLVELLSEQRRAADFKAFDVSRALEETCAYMDEQKQWSDNIEVKGPRKFFQEQVQRLVAAHPSLKLSTTEKSGEIQLTKKDMWRLEDAGIDDPFIKAYTRIGHITKYLSTYLNRDFIASDGKVHARFTSLVRTGRTACASPNVQNFPSHDKEYAPKNYFCAPPGTILCATDYSFVELVNLAESCIQRFGYSSMGDVINAGVDPHRWFAGVRDGLITNDTSFIDDPKKVDEMKAYLKENITSEQRQHSKAANFG